MTAASSVGGMLPQRLAVAAALTLVLAACGGDDDAAEPTTPPVVTTTPATVPPTTPPPATTVPVTAAPTTATPTLAPTTAPDTLAPTSVVETTVPATSAPVTTAAANDPLDTLASLLLTTDDLNAYGGPEFLDLGWENEESTSPCGGPGVDAAFPPALEVGTTLGTPADAEPGELGLIQQILVYESNEVAADARDHGLSMFSCGTTPDGQFTFGEPVDVTQEIVSDPPPSAEADYSVTAVPADGAAYDVVLFVTRYEDSLVVFQFVQSDGYPVDELPMTPADVVGLGLGKLFEFLG